jgi:hypothetical protein
MMRALSLAALALIPCLAQAVPWLTGEALLQKLREVSPQSVPWSPQSGISREELAMHYTRENIQYAHGYVEALHDATEGKVWCYDDKHEVPNPDDFWDESRWGLARLTPAQRQRSAAELLPEIWRAKWPCRSRRRTP